MNAITAQEDLPGELSSVSVDGGPKTERQDMIGREIGILILLPF